MSLVFLAHFLMRSSQFTRIMFTLSFALVLEIWSCIFEPVRKLREEAKLVKIFPEFVTGEVTPS